MTLTVFLLIASANLQPGVSLAILEEPMAQNTRKTVAWERHILGSSIFTKQSRTKDSPFIRSLVAILFFGIV